MGNSAQDHRVAIGIFAGRLCCPSWSPCTGAFTVHDLALDPDPDPEKPVFLPRLLGTLVILASLMQLWSSSTSHSGHNATLDQNFPTMTGTYSQYDDVVMERTAGHIRMLLLMSGNVMYKFKFEYIK